MRLGSGEAYVGNAGVDHVHGDSRHSILLAGLQLVRALLCEGEPRAEGRRDVLGLGDARRQRRRLLHQWRVLCCRRGITAALPQAGRCSGPPAPRRRVRQQRAVHSMRSTSTAAHTARHCHGRDGCDMPTSTDATVPC